MNLGKSLRLYFATVPPTCSTSNRVQRLGRRGGRGRVGPCFRRGQKSFELNC